MQTIRFTLGTLFAIFIFQGCAFFTKSPTPIAAQIMDSRPAEMSADQYRELATRTSSAGIGSYHAKATALWPGLDRRPTNCFDIAIEVNGSPDEALLSNWPGILTDESGQKHDLNWTDEYQTKKPTPQTIQTYHGKGKKYLNQGVACTDTLLSWAQNLSVSFAPKLMPLLVTTELSFFWEYQKDSSQQNSDPTAKPNYQKYRGY